MTVTTAAERRPPAPPAGGAAPSRRWPLRAAGLAAVASLALSVAADVVPALRHPGYSPARDLISELHARGAPAAAVAGALQVLASGLYLPAAAGLLLAGGDRRRRRLAALLLVTAAVAFVASATAFRCDPGCLPPRTGPGLAHFLVTGLGWSAYLSAVWALRRPPAAGPAWRSLAAHSRLTLGLAAAGGVALVVAPAADRLGAAERLFAYGSLPWVAALGVALLRSPPPAGRGGGRQ